MFVQAVVDGIHQFLFAFYLAPTIFLYVFLIKKSGLCVYDSLNYSAKTQ